MKKYYESKGIESDWVTDALQVFSKEEVYFLIKFEMCRRENKSMVLTPKEISSLYKIFVRFCKVCDKLDRYKKITAMIERIVVETHSLREG